MARKRSQISNRVLQVQEARELATVFDLLGRAYHTYRTKLLQRLKRAS